MYGDETLLVGEYGQRDAETARKFLIGSFTQAI